MAGPPDAQSLLNAPIPGFDGLYGLELQRADADGVHGTVAIDDRHLQPFGLVHGGVYAAMAESLASQATFTAVSGDGNMAVGLSNFTSFMRPILSGHIHAEARRRHRGSTTWVWEVELTDDEGRLCALSRVTMAVRPAPER
jgi:1,4-dihydroxy-2-naphthoyl-CoA hydrolase